MVLAGAIFISCASSGENMAAPEPARPAETEVIAEEAITETNSFNLAEYINERNLIADLFNGESNDFDLRVRANKAVYYVNDNLSISIRSNELCYFVVFHLDVNNNIQIIYPNIWEPNMNFIEPGVIRTIPEDADFRIHEPYGEEWILVFAQDRHIDLPSSQPGINSISIDALASSLAIWRSGDDDPENTTKPRGAAAQIIYSVLPR